MFQPVTLFDTCVSFVAKNIELVDSFEGFPCIVGQKIFQIAERFGKFSAENLNLTSVVKLFSESYGGEVLSSLNVSSQHLGLNYHLDQLCLFNHLVDLDCSGCGLGDDHELITHIAHLSRLEYLILQKNGLSDRGIQRLTTPHRMFQRGPAHIRYLNLSDNEDISEQSLKWLAHFKDLKTVVLSGTSLQKLAASNQNWALSHDVKHKDVRRIHNRGWAADVVDGLMKAATVRTKLNRNNLSVTSKFYSKHTKVHQAICSNRDFTSDVRKNSTAVIAVRIYGTVCTCMQSNKKCAHTTKFEKKPDVHPSIFRECQDNVVNSSLSSDKDCSRLGLYRSKEGSTSGLYSNKERSTSGLCPNKEGSRSELHLNKEESKSGFCLKQDLNLNKNITGLKSVEIHGKRKTVTRKRTAECEILDCDMFQSIKGIGVGKKRKVDKNVETADSEEDLFKMYDGYCNTPSERTPMLACLDKW